MSKRILAVLESNIEYSRTLLRGIAHYGQVNSEWDLDIQTFFYQDPHFYGNPKGKNVKKLPDYKRWKIDGIVIRAYDKTDAEAALSTNLPIVVLPTNCRIPGVINCYPDNDAVGSTAAEYFLNKGFKNFAVYNYGVNDSYWAYESGQSFAKKIAEAGFGVNFYNTFVKKPGSSWEKEQKFIAEWLSSLPKPIAVWASNDDRGSKIIASAKNYGFHVPNDVAVLGADNDPLICNLCNPTLSSIAFDLERAGYKVAETLDKLIKGKKNVCRDIIVSPTYVATRQSTSTFDIQDKMVVDAIKFIHKNTHKMLTVTDVENAMCVSRRVLERHFKAALSRSVLDEIKHARTDLIAQTLLNTSLSIADVAATLNFPNVNHMSRYFRREKNLNPLAYRKLHSNK